MNLQKHISNITGFLHLIAKTQKLIANSQIIAKSQKKAKNPLNSDNINIIITNNYKNKHLSTLRILDYFFSRNYGKILKLLITNSQYIIKILNVETIFSK